MKHQRTIVMGTVMFVFGALPGCGDVPEAVPPERPVRVAEAAPGPERDERTFPGRVAASSASVRSFRVSGTIVEKAVGIGTQVEAGDLLLRLDPADHRDELKAAESAAEQAGVAARRADTDLRRIEALYANDHASPQQLDHARTERNRARSALVGARARADLARRRLEDTELRARSHGTVVDLAVDVGENVQPGMPAVRVMGRSGLDVEIRVPETILPWIEEGDEAPVTLSTVDTDPLTAVVREVGVAPRAGGAGYPVILALDLPRDTPLGAGVYDGMSARVTLGLERSGAPERVVVPPEAVASDHEGPFVLLFESQGDGVGTVRRQRVEDPRLNSAGIEVKGPLGAGDLLVVPAAIDLPDGVRVRRSGDGFHSD